MEGREEWVPPARLKVPWSQVDEFRAEEARWAAVAALSPYQESPEVQAAKEACEMLVDQAIAGFGYKDAHLVVHDVAGLAALAGVDEGFVTSHPAGFVVDDGQLIVPWPVAVEIIKKVIQQDPKPVLAEVTKGEAKARYEAIHGHHFSSTGRNRHDYYITPEQCADFDNEHYAPPRALLRQWAGDTTAERWDELVELRKEIKRVGDVAEDAIAALRRHGHTRDADRLGTELGMTVEMLRHDTD